VSRRGYGRGARLGGNSMADRVADRVDTERNRRRTFCATCGRAECPIFNWRAPEGWLRVSVLVVVDGRDDWDVLGLVCSTGCLVGLAAKLDRQAREAADAG
jgi:hypothetical protein